jgi:hypothetical protein
LNVVVAMLERCAQSQTANTAKAVDTNFDGHVKPQEEVKNRELTSL